MNIKDSIQKQIEKETEVQAEMVTVEDFRSERTRTYRRYFDPRWDDLADDTRYWEPLLRATNKKDLELGAALLFIRAIGAQIRFESFKVKSEETEEFGFKKILVIRPVVDELGLVGWESKEQYELFRDKHLKAYSPVIRRMLDILGDPEQFKKVREMQNG